MYSMAEVLDQKLDQVLYTPHLGMIFSVYTHNLWGRYPVKLYSNATLLSFLFFHSAQMESTLKKIISDYNRSRAGPTGISTDSVLTNLTGVGEAGHPAAKIVAILNSHHDTLTSLDAKSRQLQHELLSISRDLKMAPAPY
jgi:hypothetical protein